MKNKIKTILTLLTIFTLVLLAARAAWGEVVINEVMYDPEGSDPGHEWIELYNNGPNTVDLTAWTLFENNIDHALFWNPKSTGSTFLAPGGYVIIADDADQFFVDHPNFPGTVFDSSFLLINSGETINVRDELGNLIGDDLTYNPAWGGNGNGQTLEKIDNSVNDNSAVNWQEGNLGGTPGADNNVAPTVMNDTATTDEDTTISNINVLTNDNDLDNDILKVINFDTTLIKGIVTDNGDGTFNYNPNGQFENLGTGGSTTDSFTYTISDGNGGTATATVTIAINGVDDAPKITSTPNTGATEDQEYTYNVGVEDPDDTSWLFSLLSSITGMTIDKDTGLISWTPTNDQVGNNDVKVEVSDGEATDTQEFTVDVTNVNDAPQFTSVPINTAKEGKLYTYQATALDVDVGDILTLAAPTLPGWLSFDKATGTLSGTPTDAEVGDHTVILTVSDGIAVSIEQQFTLTVEANNKPSFTSVPITTVDEGGLYQYKVTATDSDGDTLTFAAKTIPGWLTFNAVTQTLSGIPTKTDVGDHSLVLTVSDGISAPLEQAFTINVVNVNYPPLFTSAPITIVNEDTPYSYTAVASDADDDTLIFAAKTIPNWLTFDPVTKTLSGMPAQANVGDHQIVLTVSDEVALAVEQSFTITVINVNDAPQFTSVPVTSAAEDSAYSYKVTATDADGDTLTFAAPTLPSWLTFDATTQTLSGTPLQADVGDHQALLTVSDGIAPAVSQSFTITVVNVNDAPVITPIANQSGVESKKFTYLVTATDEDNEQKDLSISVADSTLGWLSVDPNNKMMLMGTPGKENIGDSNIKVVVTDGVGKSSDAAFQITVVPALEIKDDSLEIEINGQKYSAGSELNVSPGDKVKVSYQYKNNLDVILGFVKVAVLPTSENVPLEDFIIKHNAEEWALLPGLLTPKASFEFNVPLNIGNDFTISLLIADETAQGEKVYGDSASFDFKVVKEVKDVYVKSATLSDENLTCSRIPDLKLELVNTGTTSLVPEVWILNQPASSVEANTGEPISGATLKVHYPDDFPSEITPTIGAGQNETLTIPVNTTGLSGAQTLYVYVVSPFFTNQKGEKFIGDYAMANVAIKKISSCFNNAAVEQKLTLVKNSPDQVLLNLLEKDKDGKYLFLDEDKDYNDLTFEIPENGQSNPELISCSIVGSQSLRCNAPTAGKDGESQLTVKITVKIKQRTSLVEEKFNVKVTPFLKFTQAELNGKTTGPIEVKPLQPLEAKFKLKNFLSQKITKVQVKLANEKAGGPAFEFQDWEAFSLEAGQETAVLNLQETIPADVPEGTYQLALVATGEGLDKTPYSEKFPFELKVVPQPSEIVLEVKLADEKMKEVSCKNDVTLGVIATNTGIVDENDIVVIVKDGATEIWNSQNNLGGPITITKNGGQKKWPIPVKVSGKGKHALTVELNYRFDKNGLAGLTAVPQIVEVNKKSCLDTTSFTPQDANLIVGLGKTQTFTVSLNEPSFDNLIVWSVEGVNKGQGKTFGFKSEKAGTFEIKVMVNGDAQEAYTWKVTVVDKPFSTVLKTNLPATVTPEELKAVKEFTVETSFGKILFNEAVDLSNLLDLDKVIIITDGIVAVDSTNAPQLNKKATITLFKTFTNPLIKKSSGFGSGSFVLCPAAECTPVSNANGQFVFTVKGFSFSTYKGEEKVPLDLSLSEYEIYFTDVNKGTNQEVEVTVKNTGSTDTATGLKAELVGVSSIYQAQILNSLPSTLEAGKEAQVKIKLFVPSDEPSGKHTLGTFNVISDQMNKSVDIALSTKDFLAIEDIKVNGKSSGDLSLEDTNEIKVTVKNNYVQDLEGVVGTVKILDVDGDDLEEESDTFKIQKGDSEYFTVDFDLSSETVDEEWYTVEVTIEGTAVDDGSTQSVTATKSVDVAREKHKIIIKRAELSASELECTKQANLYVTVENVGKSNENNLEIRVSNAALGLEEKKENIDLDKFSGVDNEHKVIFGLDLEKAAAGTYPLQVEILRDGNLEDSQELQVTVKDCSALVASQASQTQVQLAQEELAKQLQQQLQQQVQAKAKVFAAKPTVKTSFRDSNTYLALLGLLVFLSLVALILGLAVLVVKKKQ